MIDNTKNSPASMGFSANYVSATPTVVSGYDRQLNNTPLDVYEMESDISKTQPNVEGQYHNWFTDSWNNFNNKRDEIRIMTERAKIVNEIAPELDNIENQLASNEVSEEERYELEKKKEDLIGKRQEVLNDIHEIEEGVATRAKKGVSAFYQAKEQISQNKSLTDLDYWKYSVPGTMGSSFSDMSSYMAGIAGKAISVAGNIVGGALMAAAPVTGGASIPIGAGIKTGADLLGTAVGIAGVAKANRSEALAETYGAYKDKVVKTFEDNNSNVYDYVRNLKAEDPNLTNLTDEQVLDRLLTGEITVDDDNVNTILKESKKGLDSVYNRNRALIVSDVAQNVLLGLNVGKVPVLTRKFLNATKLNKVTDPAYKAYDKVISGLVGWETRMALKSPVKAAALSTSKKLLKYGIAATAEGFEEGSQNIFNRDFLNGVYDQDSAGALKSYVDYLNANWRVGKILTGFDTESEIANDANFYNEVKGGVALGILMGSLGAVPSVTVGTAKELEANKFVRNLMLDNIAKKEQFDKIEAYSAQLSKRLNASDKIISTLENYRDHVLPTQEGTDITKEDIDNEINLFKRVKNVVNNKSFNQMAKAADFDKGSKEYNAFIGLSFMAEEDVNDATKEQNESRGRLNELREKMNKSPELLNHDGTENTVNRSINELNQRKHVVEDLLNEMENATEESKQKWGILDKSKPIGAHFTRVLNSEKQFIDAELKRIKEINDDANMLTEVNNNEALEYQQEYTTYLATTAARNSSFMIKSAYDGKLLNKDGDLVPFSKLDKEDKQEVANNIKARVEQFLKNRDESLETRR